MDMRPQRDWDPLVIHKKPPSPSPSSAAALNAALRSGNVSIEKKSGASGASGPSAARIDAETEDFHHARVPSTVRTRIVAARTEKKMSQAQLAQAMNVRPQVVQEYENGKAIPDARTLDRMARALGVPSLRR